ncbi:ammonia-forming cytochrome c nitrite reductase subunit c552 [Fuchsiella alkaliacetigena]|uniref:ammonia-forming cytochrome c nitrite reductase subunit c552 n=1 Tax=Fuchsiella alkaliacetigena TaxID=957042 RepID=UPI00200A1805|nr:ammonia-forming cytochrome c nitrite reductase subunit c552 [Fuchsiella alkaliacetigena]MCK8824803.1 ammonia-forming cytochrome c nitrite reductase subunit c552 [Fuchsiella alkaliacetigena]
MNKKILFLLAISLVFALVMVGCQEDVEETEEFRGFDSLEEAADSDAWEAYFPAQYQEWVATEEMTINPDDTTYGGAAMYVDGEVVKMDYLEIYPFLKTTYAGFPFSQSYYRSRGHAYALQDVLETGRLPDFDERPAACLSCKSTDVVVQEDKYGDDFYSKSFAEVSKDNTVGCLDCHDHEDASVVAQRSYVGEALDHDTFENMNPEGRSDLSCAQCHVNYHFDPETTKITLPWTYGLTVEDQLAHYDSVGRVNDEWEHEITGALVAKVQHPEYELFHEGLKTNVHSNMGLGCEDCHMPQQVDEAGNEYSFHQWTSPLTHVEDSCLDCHSGWGEDGVIERTEAVQSEVYEKQNRLGDELAGFIDKLGAAKDEGSLTDSELEEAQAIHREAQFYWDFVWVENSNGFHNWEEANRILDNAEELINEGLEIVE